MMTVFRDMFALRAGLASGRAAALCGRAGRDQRGVTALEYGIVAVFLVLSIIGIFTNYANTVSMMFSSTSARI